MKQDPNDMTIEDVYRALFNEFNVEKDEADSLTNKDEAQTREMLRGFRASIHDPELNEAAFSATPEEKEDRDIGKKAKYSLTAGNKQTLEVRDTFQKDKEKAAISRAKKAKTKAAAAQAAAGSTPPSSATTPCPASPASEQVSKQELEEDGVTDDEILSVEEMLRQEGFGK